MRCTREDAQVTLTFEAIITPPTYPINLHDMVGGCISIISFQLVIKVTAVLFK
jgi:hypothetical protein